MAAEGKGEDSFEDIVANLHREDPGFTAAFQEERRPPGRAPMVIGAVLCLIALAMLAFGGVKGAVLSVLPWLAGMVCVLKGRG
ncbi:DUF3040 domain-containing protein [Actinoplanes sp. N902-109]|uniref:DUF3040 domain-containing protein n=1 Tax=Actinoplanes sp. (strain N902-109) TaxID=649831 RepID=UPI0003295F71|nr:DUF3040 domain-containing protein [Actinoplanes sp. N902-109]AGL17993.1 hypothetical protein L083_4483 [Actinoplanes sp. N902-109]